MDHVETLPRTSALLGRFLDAARRHPDREAVTGPGGTLTYAQLDERTDRLAGLLAGAGAGPERAVGVFLPRTIDLVVAVLGILKAGAVYVPFDPEQPVERLAGIAEDAGVVTVLTHAALAGKLPAGTEAGAIPLDRLDWDGLPRVAPVETGPDDLAYVIFTSGSTGRPKGVAVSVTALAHFLEGMERGGFFREPGERVGWNASAAFDASVQEWVRVFRGDTVAVIDDDTRRDGEAFARFVADHRIDVVDMTPSHAQVLLEELEPVARTERPGLRLLIAGEAVPPSLWDRLAALTAEGVLSAANLYGPTEATVNALGTHVTAPGEPHIGVPLAGTAIRIVDAWLRPVPAGTAGELCLAGPGLARGYVGRPGLTATQFVPDPVGPPGSRMYRTGDRVVERADGTVRYLGRTDSQVKIRGHRIELGGVEAVLTDHPEVARAVVVSHTGEDGINRLEALLELREGGTVSAVRDRAERLLPIWMRPTGYTVVPAFPVTTSGKVDRLALAALVGSTAVAAAEPVVEPVVEPVREAAESVAEVVASVWTEVLGAEGIADDADFFDLGGHSLSAMQVATRLRARLDVKVPTSLLFRLRSFGEFAAAVAERRAEAAAGR
ncbi:amino acid adenylation domain-containing protein [Kitasatospora sp. NPDC054939]